MDETRKKLKNLIGRGRVEKVFAEIQALPDEQAGHIKNDVLLLSGQWEKIEADRRRYIIDYSDEQKGKNQIQYSLMELIDKIGKKPADDPAPPPAQNEAAAPSDSTTKILFLAANPTDTGQLRLGEEIREIDEGLRRANYRDRFDLEQKWAVRPRDLQRAMLDHKPQIVHFSGHGVPLQQTTANQPGTRSLDWEGADQAEMPTKDWENYTGGIALENSQGQTRIVKASALGGLFRLGSIKENIRCVFLNACYSDLQAEAIIQHVPFVVGMNQAVPDNTAIAFATGFYDALGAGLDIPEAFDAGVVAIELEGLTGADIPVLRQKDSSGGAGGGD